MDDDIKNLFWWFEASDSNHHEVFRSDFRDEITNGSKIIVSYSEDVCYWHAMDISGWGGFESVSILKILFYNMLIAVSKSW